MTSEQYVWLGLLKNRASETVFWVKHMFEARRNVVGDSDIQ